MTEKIGMRSRWASSVAVLVVMSLMPLIGTAGAQEAQPSPPCPDGVPEADFVDRDQARSGHARSIDCVAFHEIALGSRDAEDRRVYLPAGIVTRAQMATFVANTLAAAGHELPAGDAPHEFTDIAATVHGRRINALARAEVVAGFGDGSYRPNERITRAQMATFMVQAAEWALGLEVTAAGGPYFSDTAGNVHELNIDAGFEAGLFQGVVAPEPGVERSGRYAPRDGTRRDQMATFLSRLLDHLWGLEGIDGRVTDAVTGDPVPGATVAAFAEPVGPDDDPLATATTDSSGQYLLDPAPGTYTVSASADGFVDAEKRTGVTVTRNRLTTVDFTLEPADPPADVPSGTIIGRVTDTAAAPIAGATVTARTNGTQAGQATTDATGNYSLQVDAGTYTVTADAGGFLPASAADVTVPADGTVTRDFTLLVEPATAVLTPDRELAPTSEEANPSIDTPTRGAVEFALTLYDDKGNPLSSEYYAYDFSIVNNGTNPVQACILCGAGSSPEIWTLAPGGTLTFQKVPGHAKVRVDADEPTSVTITVGARSGDKTYEASRTMAWVSVDEAPTGTGQAVTFSGSILAFDGSTDWYLMRTPEELTVFVEYSSGATDFYVSGAQTLSLLEFEQLLFVGADATYSVNDSNNQVHVISEPLG